MPKISYFNDFSNQKQNTVFFISKTQELTKISLLKNINFDIKKRVFFKITYHGLI